MNSLKRQASKAERYARLREEMRAKLRLVLASKFAAIEQESAELDSQLNVLAEEMQHRTEEVQMLDAEHAERTQRGYSIEAELRENRDRISQIALEIDRAHARRRHNEERCAELLVRSASAEAELGQARHRQSALEAERDANRQILEAAGADLAAAQSDLALCQQDATAAAASLAEIERQQEESRVAIFDTVSSGVAPSESTGASGRAPGRRGPRCPAARGRNRQRYAASGSIRRTARATGSGI